MAAQEITFLNALENWTVSPEIGNFNTYNYMCIFVLWGTLIIQLSETCKEHFDGMSEISARGDEKSQGDHTPAVVDEFRILVKGCALFPNQASIRQILMSYSGMGYRGNITISIMGKRWH